MRHAHSQPITFFTLLLCAAVASAQILQEDAPPPPAVNPGYVLAVILALVLIACLVILVKVRQSVARMSTQHDQLMRSVIARSNKLEATLSSMVEGVLAVDTEQRIIGVNEAAGRLLNLRPDRAAGRHIDDAITSEPLRRLARQTLETDQPIQVDVELVLHNMLSDAGEPVRRLFLAQGAVLRDVEGQRIGTLIVLHDVTRLRRLEVVRRDFVTNASHEIKTPVAAIKAAAETIIDCDGEAEPTRQFLGVIARQADRLQNIVEDLLALARIEQDQEQSRIVREPRRIGAVLAAAVETCQVRAAERGSRVIVDCPDDLEAAVNQNLLEQAVINLLDNAIKYSPPGSEVHVKAYRRGDEVAIAVRDQGPGIAAEHLPRVFERFYRTDKARSRDIGGTGLGLAIVKHIALAHAGRVSVHSNLGHGSTFTIHLPAGAEVGGQKSEVSG